MVFGLEGDAGEASRRRPYSGSACGWVAVAPSGGLQAAQRRAGRIRVHYQRMRVLCQQSARDSGSYDPATTIRLSTFWMGITARETRLFPLSATRQPLSRASTL
jgi:hypothetical protein